MNLHVFRALHLGQRHDAFAGNLERLARRVLALGSSEGRDCGGLAAILSVMRDVTERKRAEAALRESEARERARSAELETLMEATAQLHQKMLAMNEELMRGSLSQHKLTDAAEELNEKLRAEITERKAAEAAPEESGHRLRSILDTMFVFVGFMNLNGEIVEVNQAHLEAAGLKRE